MGGRPALEGTTVLELSSGHPRRVLRAAAGDARRRRRQGRVAGAARRGPGRRRPAATASSTPRSARWPSTSPTPAGRRCSTRLVGRRRRRARRRRPRRAAGRAGPLRRAARRPPRLVIASFSPYGLDGPRAGWLSTELTELAAGGFLAVGPHGGPADHARARRAAAAASAPSARSASLLALAARRRDGTRPARRGQHCRRRSSTCSRCRRSCTASPASTCRGWATATRSASTRAPTATSACNILTQGHWTGLCRLMGRDDLVDHPRYRTGVERADPAVAAELDADHHRVGAPRSRPRRRSTPPRRCAAPITIVPGPPSRAGVARSTRPATTGSTTTTPELGPLRLPGCAVQAGVRRASPRSGRRHRLGADAEVAAVTRRAPAARTACGSSTSRRGRPARWRDDARRLRRRRHQDRGAAAPRRLARRAPG